MREAVPVKYLSTSVFVEADGFEDLRAAIALQRRNAHLRKDFEQSFVDGLDVLIDGLFEGDAFGQIAAHCEIFERLDGQVRVDGAGAVADQQREVHHFARLAGFDDERDLRARTFADQMIMHGGQGQQAGDGRVLRIDAAVGKDEDRVAVLNGRAKRGGRGRRARARGRYRLRRPGTARTAWWRGNRPARRGAAFPDRGWSGSDAAA